MLSIWETAATKPVGVAPTDASLDGQTDSRSREEQVVGLYVGQRSDFHPVDPEVWNPAFSDTLVPTFEDLLGTSTARHNRYGDWSK
jgi:hypothetical protein